MLLIALLCISALCTAETVWRTSAEEGAVPKWVARPEGGWTGYCPDLLHALSQQDPALKFSVTKNSEPQKRLEASLLSRRIDFICTLTRVGFRERYFSYLQPALYRMTFALVARVEDAVIVQSWDDVRRLGPEGVVLLNHDSSRVQVLKEMGGLNLRTEGLTTEANLRMLLAGRGRFFYFPRANAMATAGQLGLSDRLRYIVPEASIHQYYLLVHPEHPPAERERLERALEALSRNGVLQVLAQRWGLE